MKFYSSVVLWLLCVLLCSCVSDGQDITNSKTQYVQDTGKLICGKRFIGFVDRDEMYKYETYHLNTINRELRGNPELRKYVGLDRVGDCRTARYAVPKIQEYWEARDVESPPDRLEVIRRVRNGILVTDPKVPGSVKLSIYASSSATSGGFCTGIIITRRAILTSAHCVDYLLTGTTGTVHVSAYKIESGGTWHQIWSKGQPTNATFYPDYIGSGGAGHDIAILYKYGNTSGLTNDDFSAIYDDPLGPINSFRYMGAGVTSPETFDSGTLYLGFAYNMAYKGSQHFFNRADTVYRMCDGDSGGPAYFAVTGAGSLVLGLASNSEGIGCTERDGKERWTRIGPKLDWIESELDIICVPYTDQSTGYHYRKCASTYFSGCNTSGSSSPPLVPIVILLAVSLIAVRRNRKICGD